MKSCITIGFHQSVCRSPSKLADAIHPDANNAYSKHFHKIINRRIKIKFCLPDPKRTTEK